MIETKYSPRNEIHSAIVRYVAATLQWHITFFEHLLPLLVVCGKKGFFHIFAHQLLSEGENQKLKINIAHKTHTTGPEAFTVEKYEDKITLK